MATADYQVRPVDDQIDAVAGTQRRATVAKVLRDRNPQAHPTLIGYIGDARAVLDALDELDAYPVQLVGEATALTQQQAIRLGVLRALIGVDGYVREVDGEAAQYLDSFAAVADPLVAWVEAGSVPDLPHPVDQPAED